MSSDYIGELSKAISSAHGCSCSHLSSEKIEEAHEDVGVWEGNVEIFELQGHPEAGVAYGWGWQDDDGKVHYIGVLKTGNVESASDAVKSAIASGQLWQKSDV